VGAGYGMGVVTAGKVELSKQVRTLEHDVWWIGRGWCCEMQGATLYSWGGGGGGRGGEGGGGDTLPSR